MVEWYLCGTIGVMSEANIVLLEVRTFKDRVRGRRRRGGGMHCSPFRAVVLRCPFGVDH